MKKILLIMTMFMVLTTSAFAEISATTIGNAGWDKLSDAQKSEVLQVVANKVVETDKNKISTNDLNNPAKLNEWVDLGKNIGLAFNGAAKELGIAVNDFVNTPVGMITMILIIWHFMGGMILHFVGSILVLVVGLGFVRWHYRTQVEMVEEYSLDKTNIFGNARLVSRTEPSPDNDWKVWYMIIGVITIIGSLVVAFTY